jgi:hypothetical protein
MSMGNLFLTTAIMSLIFLTEVGIFIALGLF